MMQSKKNISLIALVCLTSTTAIPKLAAAISTPTAQLSTQAPRAYSKEQITELINETAATLAYTSGLLNKNLEALKNNNPSEEIIAQTITELLAHKVSPEQRTALSGIQKAIEEELKDYRVTGMAFTYDFNKAFFVNTQDPLFTVTYKNAAGEIKNRTFQAEINFVGWNIELAYRFNFIFFTNTNFNFFETNQKIVLGKGIQCGPIGFAATAYSSYANAGITVDDILNNRRQIVGNPALLRYLSPLNFTYVPFQNAPGGIVIIGYVVGIPTTILNLGDSLGTGGGIGMITGGSLTPVV